MIKFVSKKSMSATIASLAGAALILQINFVSAAGFTKLFEAEENTTTNYVDQSTEHSGYTGTGFMDFGGADSSLTWNKVEVSSAGTYTLIFRYSNGGTDGGSRPCTVDVNGKPLSKQIEFGNIGDWETWKTDSITATLKAGVNTIKLTAVDNGPNIDSLTVTNDPATISTPTATSAPSATPTTTPAPSITPTPTAAPKAESIMVLKLNSPIMTVNGTSKEIDPGKTTGPLLDAASDRTLVPIRAIVEEMGGNITFDSIDKNGRLDITLGKTTIKIWLNDKNAEVNGKALALDVTPTTINDRTMLPLRFVTENLGANVTWNDSTQEIIIKYKK